MKQLAWKLESSGLIPCWSGEVIPLALAIDATIGRSRPSSPRRGADGADIRPLIDRTPCARFAETTLKAPHALRRLSACYERFVNHRVAPPMSLGRLPNRADLVRARFSVTLYQYVQAARSRASCDI